MITKIFIQETTVQQGMLDNVMRQFDDAADIIGLNPNIRKVFLVTNI